MKTLESLTLDDILKHAEPEGNCLAWTGYAKPGGYPSMRIGGSMAAVRRVLYTLVHEKKIRKGFQVGVSCETEKCVHPDCLVARQKSAIQRGMKASIESRIANSRAKRKTARLNIEIVRAIRASSESARALERSYGLAHCYVARIKRGDVWIDHTNPFAKLGGRG